mmetsp:Transcript_6032/g.5198  ORF Transcript_6032/g.5198 Transcript_6032/m.5198 type:complete len:216 (+) Transcript_6032:185-832(+)
MVKLRQQKNKLEKTCGMGKTVIANIITADELNKVDQDTSRVEESKEFLFTARQEAQKSNWSINDPDEQNDIIHNIEPEQDVNMEIRKMKATLKESVVKNNFEIIVRPSENEYDDALQNIIAQKSKPNKMRALEQTRNHHISAPNRKWSNRRLSQNNFVESKNDHSNYYDTIKSHRQKETLNIKLKTLDTPVIEKPTKGSKTSRKRSIDKGYTPMF